jgi:histidinol phosphatase-like PHP family hydrolase
MARDIDFVIDTDSHHVSDLVRMDYGVSYAQRGWVTTDRVANAKPLEEFLTWAGRRRS